MSLSPPSRTSTAPVSPAKPSALQVIPPTRHTASLVCCHQGGDCGVSRRGPADWRTASFIRLSGSWTPSRPRPPSPLLPHAPLNSDPPPPPPTHPTPTHTHTVTSTSHFVQHWTDLIQLPLLTVWIKTALFVTINRIDLISSLHYTIYILHCFFISLVCTLSNHVPYATYLFLLYIFFFLFTCPYLYICNSCILCMYVYIYIYIYIYIYVCMYVCMYPEACVLQVNDVCGAIPRGTKSLSRTFSWTVPSWWNDLPISIRTAESLAIFKNI